MLRTTSANIFSTTALFGRVKLKLVNVRFFVEHGNIKHCDNIGLATYVRQSFLTFQSTPKVPTNVEVVAWLVTEPPFIIPKTERRTKNTLTISLRLNLNFVVTLPNKFALAKRIYNILQIFFYKFDCLHNLRQRCGSQRF